MPRAAKTSSRKHAPAVSLTKRSFAVDDSQVAAEKVLPGSAPSTTIADITAAAATTPAGSKPEKPFLGAIQAGLASQPYSRSHIRREKRKAREVIGGGMSSVAAALAEAVGEVPVPEAPVPRSKGHAREVAVPQKAKQEPDGRIGAGRTNPMNEKQRRKQIARNAQRIPAVMQHPAFKANPWATIREHANNSLATAEAAQSIAERKAADESRKVKAAENLAAAMSGIE